jgi:hypothetical protein
MKRQDGARNLQGRTGRVNRPIPQNWVIVAKFPGFVGLGTGLFGIQNKGGAGSRILRGWVWDSSGDVGLGFCVVVGVIRRVGVRFVGWGLGSGS